MIARFIFWVMRTQLYKWFLKNIFWRLRFSNYYTKIKGYQYYVAQHYIQPGDIILAVDKAKASSLIPGVVDHAAVCWDKKPEYVAVAEMTHKDFCYSTLFDVCKESDRIVIMRCKDFDPAYVRKFCNEVHKYKSAEYDVEFTLGVENLYCSELIYHMDIEKRIKYDLSDLLNLGREYISPEGLMLAENMVCVFDTDNLFISMTGAEIKNCVRNHKD